LFPCSKRRISETKIGGRIGTDVANCCSKHRSDEIENTTGGAAPNLLNTSFTMTADVEVAHGGAEGMINTNGGRFGGYGFYLLKSKPVFVWNLLDLKRARWESPEALTPGKHTVEFDFKYEGLGFATLAFNNLSGICRSATGTLKVDGKVVATQSMERTIPIIFSIDETCDVLTPVRLSTTVTTKFCSISLASSTNSPLL
jgi:hypothetical protein